MAQKKLKVNSTKLGGDSDGFSPLGPWGKAIQNPQPGVPSPVFGSVGDGLQNFLAPMFKGVEGFFGGLGGGGQEQQNRPRRPDTISSQQKILEGQRHAQRGRQQQDRVYANIAARQQQQPEDPKQFASFADYLRQAQELLAGTEGGGVNYDPQRDALRQNAGTADSRLAEIYTSLQQQFANADPAIAQRYTQSGEDIDLNSAQAANAVDTSNTAIRDEQTRQLQALGIQDAIANVAPQQAADQANAKQAIERQGQIAGDANTQFGSAARTFNTENQQTAGLEGASKRAGIQTNLLAALADVDASEQDANASLSNQRQGSALSIAQLLQAQDPEGASAAAAQAQAAMEAAQQQFENEMAVRTFDAKYGQQRPQGLGLQQVLDLLGQQGVSADKTAPEDLARLVSAYSNFKF